MTPAKMTPEQARILGLGLASCEFRRPRPVAESDEEIADAAHDYAGTHIPDDMMTHVIRAYLMGLAALRAHEMRLNNPR